MITWRSLSAFARSVHVNQRVQPQPRFQIVKKYREFIQHVRSVTASTSLSNGQNSMAKSIVLVPIAANAISELNDILNRLIRMTFDIEAESDYARQVLAMPTPIESKELYRQDTDASPLTQILSSDRLGSLRSTTMQPYASGSNVKRTNVRNQSAIVSTADLASSPSTSGYSFKLTPNVIADIFEMM